jgi:hypothetical protein
MKYRILNHEELSFFEEELKAFLIINGVDGDTWKKINENQPDKAIELVELFSDTVLEKIYSNIHYLEFRSKDSCIVFHVGEQESKLISIQTSSNENIDLSTPETIHEALQNKESKLNFFKQTKKHQKTREMEVHTLLESGCVPSAQAFWDALNLVTSNNE